MKFSIRCIPKEVSTERLHRHRISWSDLPMTPLMPARICSAPQDHSISGLSRSSRGNQSSMASARSYARPIWRRYCRGSPIVRISSVTPRTRAFIRMPPDYDAELLFARAPRHPASYFESATASCIFRDGDLREIVLYPIDLGIDGPASDLGTPRRATGALATKILERIVSNCEPFGTKVSISGGLGHIVVAH